jgi:hypothetical protein
LDFSNSCPKQQPLIGPRCDAGVRPSLCPPRHSHSSLQISPGGRREVGIIPLPRRRLAPSRDVTPQHRTARPHQSHARSGAESIGHAGYFRRRGVASPSPSPCSILLDPRGGKPRHWAADRRAHRDAFGVFHPPASQRRHAGSRARERTERND